MVALAISWGLKPRLYCTLQHSCLLPSAFFTLLLFLVISLAASPAIAAINTNSNKSFLQQFAETYASLKIYIKQFEAEFSQGWGELSNSVQQSIESSIGDLGMPDPIKSGRQINITIGNQKTNIATTDPGLQGNDAQHRWHQQYSLGQVESVLGKEGQQVQAQEADMTNNALSTSMDLGDAAQGDIVTQDILKKMAIQSAQENIIFKSMHGEAQKQTRSLAAVNINLTDISGRMDEQSRRQQFEDNASARQVMESAAFTDGFWEKTKR